MAQPAKPPALLPGKAYIHITSSLPPSSISEKISIPDHQITYVGPVGELQGEHIFQVESAAGRGVLERSEIPEGDVLRAVRGVEGVKGAKVLETKQRVKRDEF